MKKVIVSTTEHKSKLDQHNTIMRNKKRYSVKYNLVNTEMDDHHLLKEFKAQVSEIHPYDDADYAWANINSGVIEYIQSGKVIDKSYYGSPDDMDIEHYEWCDAVIDSAIDNLTVLNKDLEPRIIHN